MTRIWEDMGLFVGVLAAGVPVLLPAICLLIHNGAKHAASFYTIALGAILVSDTAWYLVGRCGAFEKVRARVLRRTNGEYDGGFARGVIRRRGPLLFASRFVYGTKIAMQVLSGFTRLHFRIYIGISLASAVTWLMLLTILGLLFGSALHKLELGVEGTRMALAGLVAAVLIVNIGSRRIIRARRAAATVRAEDDAKADAS